MTEKMDTLQLARNLIGIKTLIMVQNRLGVDRSRAIYLLYKLRKEGYVKTYYQSAKTRVYYISPENALGGVNYVEIINKYSPIKLLRTDIYKIHGEEPSIEETLVYAIKNESIRFVIASISLFREIRNWSRLYNLAKKEGIVREVAALYDVARLYIPKLRKMPKRFKTLATPKKTDKFKYIVDKFSSMHFKEIENKWKVYIPLNEADLREYKGVVIS